MNNNNVDELRNALQVIIELLEESENGDLIKELVRKPTSLENDDKIRREEMIDYIMKNLGIPANLLGYGYIATSVELVLDKKVGRSVTKELYPEVAKKFGTSSSRVERAIRHAVEAAISRGNREMFEMVFGYSFSAYKGKPTNSEFIYGLANHIRLQEQRYSMRYSNL